MEIKIKMTKYTDANVKKKEELEWLCEKKDISYIANELNIKNMNTNNDFILNTSYQGVLLVKKGKDLEKDSDIKEMLEELDNLSEIVITVNYIGDIIDVAKIVYQ